MNKGAIDTWLPSDKLLDQKVLGMEIPDLLQVQVCGVKQHVSRRANELLKAAVAARTGKPNVLIEIRQFQYFSGTLRELIEEVNTSSELTLSLPAERIA